MNWVDTHCHLDAPEFAGDRAAVLQRALAQGVGTVVMPAVRLSDISALQAWARQSGQPYALGIHPLCVSEAEHADEADSLQRLEQALRAALDDPLLVAVGEIGLDHFVPDLDHERQLRFYRAQLRLARDCGLPVLLHVRRSADALLRELRRCPVAGGIAHAFNGSFQQAEQFLERGFVLGFGGTLTFERSLQIRRLACALPADGLVLETDAPDIPPQWLYRPAVERVGAAPVRNEPAELPRIGAVLAQLRSWTLEETALRTRANAQRALPRLRSDQPLPSH